ncbi:MAG TPA: hypothetical protein DCS05_02515 [Nitrospiraceae bacterium]|nr:hypothetical protein [Nitrospiraceae bacterium]
MGKVFESAFQRFVAGVAEQWDKTVAQHQVPPEVMSGIWKWFKTTHPQKHQNLKECEDRIDALWLAGGADQKTQNEFNEQLRIYRNGHLWLIEKFIAWRKEQEAEERKNAGKPKQGRLI